VIFLILCAAYKYVKTDLQHEKFNKSEHCAEYRKSVNMVKKHIAKSTLNPF